MDIRVDSKLWFDKENNLFYLDVSSEWFKYSKHDGLLDIISLLQEHVPYLVFSNGAIDVLNLVV